jgi:Luciferase-like monooxygenase
MHTERMRFGTYYFLQAPSDRSAAEIICDEVEQMVLAEELGFDSIWLTEHHCADYVGLDSRQGQLRRPVLVDRGRSRVSEAIDKTSPTSGLCGDQCREHQLGGQTWLCALEFRPDQPAQQQPCHSRDLCRRFAGVRPLGGGY